MTLPSFPTAGEARREEGLLSAPDGVRLHWERYTPAAPRAAVAVLPGGGDHAGRYPGLTAALVRAGLQVALVDFRGHGRSEGRRWHVDAYGDYLGDADAFLEHVRAGAAGRPLFLVGHSQGGLVATLWALAAPRALAGVVLSSPFFRLARRPPVPKLLAAHVVGRLWPALPIATGLRSADLTGDPEMQRWIDADPLYGRAATPRWFLESRRVQRTILEEAHRFADPLLVLTGTGDVVADAAATRAFFEAAGSADKQLRTYEGFRHELFNERERERPIGDVVAWISARGA